MSIVTKQRNSIKCDSIPDDFLELQQMLFPLCPIHTKADYDKALKAAGELAARDNLTQVQTDYLEILTNNIESYENPYFSSIKQDPIEILRFLLDENNLTGSDLGRILGHRELGSKILNRKRGLSVNHIKTLSQHFSVSPKLFL
jgi:HTH-type transcriptional regulator/antitoxin HigA